MAISGNKVQFTLTGDWKRFAASVDGQRFMKRFKPLMLKANDQIGRYLVDKIQDSIESREYTSNAVLTSIFKDDDTPLVESGKLLRSIVYSVPSWDEVVIGVSGSAKTSSGEPMWKLASRLHGPIDGSGGNYTFPVTDAMRGLFGILAAYTNGNVDLSELSGRARKIAMHLDPADRIYPLGPDTTHITVPYRPFVAKPLQDAQTKAFVRSVWQRAVQEAARTKS